MLLGMFCFLTTLFSLITLVEIIQFKGPGMAERNGHYELRNAPDGKGRSEICGIYLYCSRHKFPGYPVLLHHTLYKAPLITLFPFFVYL